MLYINKTRQQNVGKTKVILIIDILTINPNSDYMCINSVFSLPCSRLITIMVNIYSTNKSAREIYK